MAGREGARGYVYQALVALFKCFQYDSWNQIKVEPLTNDDKVDILLKKDEVLTKAIQVKSSINKFEKPDIERWIYEIKKDVIAMEYELVLVGDSFTKPAREFIEKNNENNNVYIEIIEGGERGLEKLTKSYVFEFLECYNSECSITINQIENMINGIFAKLMKISTNESWFSQNDLITIINKNITSNIEQRKKRYLPQNAILGFAIIVVFWFSIYISRNSFSMVYVVFSDVMIGAIWGLLKYSDIHFWRNLECGSERYYSRKYSSECKSISVNIRKNNMLNVQKVYIENLLAERIDYIEGVIKFFSGDTEKNFITFKKRDIDSGREVKIDEISYNTDYQYSDKIYWDEVELHIDKIVSKDTRACIWGGIVIRFVRIYNLDQFNYLRLGEIQILPYEITWLKNEIVKKIWYYIRHLMRRRMGGYDKNNFWNGIKIKTIGFYKSVIYRILGGFLIGIIFAVAICVAYGQLYWISEFLRCLFR